MVWQPSYIEWQSPIRRRHGVPREFEPKLLGAMGSRPAKIVTRFRRSGKSFLVQQVVVSAGVKTREAVASSGGGNGGTLAFEAGSGMLSEGYVAIEVSKLQE